MTNKLPEALRLADALKDPEICTLSQMRQAALLRTQHALLERAGDKLSLIAEGEDYGKLSPLLAALNQHLEPQ